MRKNTKKKIAKTKATKRSKKRKALKKTVKKARKGVAKKAKSASPMLTNGIAHTSASTDAPAANY